MNFQFTSKIKLFTIVLMVLGGLMTFFGAYNEEAHLYTTPCDELGAKWAQESGVTFPLLSQKNEDMLVSSNEEVSAVIVEYYHELPYSTDDLKAKINEAAKKHNLTIEYIDLVKHDHAHGDVIIEHSEELIDDTVEEHTTVIVNQEAHHNDGNTEAAAHGEENHDLVWLLIPHKIEANHKEGDHSQGHDTHGAEHSPVETLTHIIHEEGAFADSHHSRSWSNFLVNAFFFFGIGLGALFFIALQYATESGWGVVTKRVVEAITAYIPVGALMLGLVFLASSLGWNHIYHWMDESLHDPYSPHYDAIIANKKPFLTQWFFWTLTIVCFVVFIWFRQGFRKRSLQEDIEGGTKIHFRNFAKGALFLVLFGYLSSVMSWQWIMSIDTHWFSTLFGWYVFSGIWISGVITILLTIFFLKGQGYLDFVNESHIHDLGKWMFAVSILWAYLFFSQFMLIWYANIPEEVTYYATRFADYKYILWGMFAINLILPLIFLMSREAKRSKVTIVILGVILLLSHWVDVFIMVMPGTVFDHWKIGVLEIGMFLFFAGLFIHVILRALTKAPLLVKNHPYLDENINQHT
jgi:hypothetical protein